jgi:hypothetical protein
MFIVMQQIPNKQQLNSNKGMVFSVQSMPRCYNQNGLEQSVWCSVESQSLKRRLGGQSKMATNLGVSLVVGCMPDSKHVSRVLKSVTRKRFVEKTLCVL